MPTPEYFFIDDDEDDRDFFCSAVQNINSNINCNFAKDGIEGIAYLKAHQAWVPNGIFIDMNMPKIDGKQCLMEIREIQELKDVPIYIYSTSGSTKLIDELLSLGATEFLIKPVTMSALESMLRRIIG